MNTKGKRVKEVMWRVLRVDFEGVDKRYCIENVGTPYQSDEHHHQSDKVQSSSTQPKATILSQTTKPRKSFKTNLLKKKPPKETKQQ